MLIAIKNMRAGRVNMLGNDFVSGMPSPFAFLGLVASLAPRWDVARWSVGVLPILHKVSIATGRTKGEQERDGPRKFKSLEIPEDMRGTVEFSLIVDLGADAYVDKEEIKAAILSARLAGGAIFPAHGHDARAEVVDGGAALHGVRHGRCMIPVQGAPVASGRGDDLFALADAVFPEGREKGDGWKIPVAVGYDLIGTPSLTRKGVRDSSVPHSFAEPLAGVAELVSPHSPRWSGCDDEGLRACMWRYATQPGRVAAHPFYLHERI